jgi:hypothetical protein
MSTENPLWGAPRIHGELLKLGFEVSQSSVTKYMVRRRGPPSQGWRTFLRNHAPDIAAMDLFVVPTLSFKLLYAFVMVRLDRRAAHERIGESSLLPPCTARQERSGATIPAHADQAKNTKNVAVSTEHALKRNGVFISPQPRRYLGETGDRENLPSALITPSRNVDAIFLSASVLTSRHDSPASKAAFFAASTSFWGKKAG